MTRASGVAKAEVLRGAIALDRLLTGGRASAFELLGGSPAMTLGRGGDGGRTRARGEDGGLAGGSAAGLAPDAVATFGMDRARAGRADDGDGDGDLLSPRTTRLSQPGSKSSRAAEAAVTMPSRKAPTTTAQPRCGIPWRVLLRASISSAMAANDSAEGTLGVAKSRAT